INLWDVSNKTLITSISGNNSPIRLVDFSPDGKILLFGDWAGKIRLWNVKTRSIVEPVWYKDMIYPAAFLPVGKILVSGGVDNTIKLWDIEKRYVISSVVSYDSGSIRAMAVSPKGRFLALGYDDNTIKVWDVQEKSFIYTFNGHSDSIYAIAFSKDGNVLASGSEDNSIKMWDMKNGRHVMTLLSFVGNDFIIYKPDNSFIASEPAKRYISYTVGLKNYPLELAEKELFQKNP
ncbi:MAG: WD40 repeat domain-containing protein, partial [Thermodesulfobacteriota bacterium]